MKLIARLNLDLIFFIVSPFVFTQGFNLERGYMLSKSNHTVNSETLNFLWSDARDNIMEMRKLTKDEENNLISLALAGESIQNIRAVLKLERMDLYRYFEANPDFREEFTRARQEGLDELADSLLNMHEEIQDVQRARLASDNHKWVLSKRKPQTYGDRIDLNVNQTVDIKGALEVAKARAMLPPRYPTNVIDAEVIDSTKQIECSETAVTADAPKKLPEDIFK